jgi:septum formation protein
MLVLRSTSPRRIQIFKELGLTFSTAPPVFSEESFTNEKPLAYLERVTRGKLFSIEVDSEHTYISADTIIVFQGEILQKPSSKEDAISMLEKMNGNWHYVYSALGIYSKGEVFFDYDSTLIKTKQWNKTEITNYIEKANPLDKAGSYGIQDDGSPVEEYRGSFINVVGFPLRKFFNYYPYWVNYLY